MQGGAGAGGVPGGAEGAQAAPHPDVCTLSCWKKRAGASGRRPAPLGATSHPRGAPAVPGAWALASPGSPRAARLLLASPVCQC